MNYLGIKACTSLKERHVKVDIQERSPTIFLQNTDRNQCKKLKLELTVSAYSYDHHQ